MLKNIQKHSKVEKLQRDELLSGWNEDRMFVNTGGVGALHWQRGPD